MSITFRARTKEGFFVDSPLKPFFFPDGAAHIKGADEWNPMQFQYQIADVRHATHDDLFALAMWANVCDDFGQKTVVLLPYLPGARADRGHPFGAAIYGDFLTGLLIDQIIVIDPHSPVAPSKISNPDIPGDSFGGGNNVTIFPFERIIHREIQSVDQDWRGDTYAGVIAPDHGAVDRASRAAKVMGVNVYRAGKTRDFETGKLTGFHMEDELPDEGRFLIVDDICDGGGTFIGLAEAIGLPPERIDLWVTHGLFTQGLGRLHHTFGRIHTTNSVIHSEDERVTPYGKTVIVHDVTPYLIGAINLKETK